MQKKMPQCLSLWKNSWCEMVSKTLKKSSVSTFACLLWSKEERSQVLMRSCTSQELLQQNPWPRLLKSLCASKWILRWWQMMCFNRVHATDVREMGLKFSKRGNCPFCMSMTLLPRVCWVEGHQYQQQTDRSRKGLAHVLRCCNSEHVLGYCHGLWRNLSSRTAFQLQLLWPYSAWRGKC